MPPVTKLIQALPFWSLPWLGMVGGDARQNLFLPSWACGEVLTHVGRWRQAHSAVRKACIHRPLHAAQGGGECGAESKDLENSGSKRGFFPTR